MSEEDFKVSIEISREWDGEKVANELTEKIKKKISSPKFILLFTTIHYQKEFNKILNGIKKNFSGSPIIGGTVAGFITHEGCFTRGVTASAIQYPNMEIFYGVGTKTKKDPKKAVNDFLDMIKIDHINNDKFLIFDIISGSVIPELPKMGRTNVSFSKSKSSLLSALLPIAGKFGTGVGKEEEILKHLSDNFPNSYLFGLSSMDDGKMLKNFQFLNNEYFSNSFVGLIIKSDLDFNISYTHGLTKTEKKFKITKISNDKRVIKELDGKPAVDRFMEVMGWSKESIGDLDKFYRTTFFYPFGFKKDDFICPCNIGGFLGSNIPLGYGIEGDDLVVLSATGKSLIGAVKDLAERSLKDKKFNMFITCGATLEALGDKVFEIKDILLNNFTNFLVIYGSGENFYIPSKKSYHLNESIILLQI
jgi:hypothetical protein